MKSEKANKIKGSVKTSAICLHWFPWVSSMPAVVMKTEKQSIVPKSFIVMMMVMLGIALLPIRYYGYYVLLKIVICGGCAFLAAIAYGDGRKYLVWFGGGLAVLYNPIIRFPLGRELWIVVNILTIILLIVAMKTLKK